jgi:hypothetical protein
VPHYDFGDDHRKCGRAALNQGFEHMASLLR